MFKMVEGRIRDEINGQHKVKLIEFFTTGDEERARDWLQRGT
jgi:hypothetical protein